MVLGIITRVVKLVPKVFHVLVDVLRLDLKEQGIRVRVEQVHSRAVLKLQMLVVEVVHQGFGKIQDAHARVDWTLEEDFALVHLNVGVQGNAGLHPRPLLELKDFVDLPQPHPKVQVLLEGPVVQNVPGLVS